MKTHTKNLLRQILLLEEFERKQLMSCIVASLLNDLSNEEARETYDSIMEQMIKY